jgi:diketogulonate reductase-like aldo/keto reductase
MKTKKVLGGQTMPAIGFGTGEIAPDDAKEIVLMAIQAGYRLIDTARIYDNEQGIGEAVRESGIPRHDFFITTKLWNDDQGYDSAAAAYEVSLGRLGLEYADLYLIHWPATSRRLESWRALTDLKKQGRVKAVGVSNYTVRHLEEVLETSAVTPSVNQVEFHPFIYEQQKPLLEFCKRHSILVEAYSPLMRIAKNVHPTIQSIATQLDKMPAQVVLRWCIQHGTVPLPRSQDQKHMQQNIEVFDFELDERAMQSLNHLSDGERVTWDPAKMH